MLKEPPTRALLERLIDPQRVEDFLNQRSPAYKERSLGERKLTKAQAIELMLEEPNLIRRPIVLSGTKAVFGYQPAAYDDLFGS
jgi:arsenate reductase-like glutaredoxin family protein